jgi:hypothetical protein
MRSTPLVALVTVALVAACGSDSDYRASNDTTKNVQVAGVSFSARDSSRELGPGDLIITDRDSSLDLLLVGNHIATRFSAKTMAKINEKTDTNADKGSGLTASISKMVKSTVQSQLSKEVRYPLSDIRDARYEDDRLVIELKNGKRLFQDTKINNRRFDESFTPDDARRFADAVNARVKSQTR